MIAQLGCGLLTVILAATPCQEFPYDLRAGDVAPCDGQLWSYSQVRAALRLKNTEIPRMRAEFGMQLRIKDAEIARITKRSEAWEFAYTELRDTVVSDPPWYKTEWFKLGVAAGIGLLCGYGVFLLDSELRGR